MGVISDESHFIVGMSVCTKLRNDSEKDFPNVVILIFALRKRMVNETMENPVTTVKVRTTQENRRNGLSHGNQVVQRIHPEKDWKDILRKSGPGKKHQP